MAASMDESNGERIKMEERAEQKMKMKKQRKPQQPNPTATYDDFNRGKL